MLSNSKLYVEPDEIVAFLKQTLSLKEIYQRILYKQVISQAAEERGITVTPEEIQAEADRQRREKRLEKAADTLAWLSEQMITPDDWEAGIRHQVLAQKLAKHLFDQEIEKYFAQNKLDFERIVLYQIVVASDKLAQELFYQIEDREISFYEAAHLYDIDKKRRLNCGYEGELYRWSLKPDIAAVFSGKPGEVLGPFSSDQGCHLLMVEEFIPAELTLERYQEILDSMFQEWLASELNYMLHNKTD
jgi:parvulin-like peptidyl-prolyl isomerase